MIPEAKLEPTPAPYETAISPLAAAISATPQFADFCKKNPPKGATSGGSHPLLLALAAFLASPAGQALEQALIAMLLNAIPR